MRAVNIVSRFLLILQKNLSEVFLSKHHTSTQQTPQRAVICKAVSPSHIFFNILTAVIRVLKTDMGNLCTADARLWAQAAREQAEAEAEPSCEPSSGYFGQSSCCLRKLIACTQVATTLERQAVDLEAAAHPALDELTANVSTLASLSRVSNLALAG